MDVVQLLEQLLYEVATALYLPVIAGCAFLVCYTPLQLGMTLFEAWQRFRSRFEERAVFAGAVERIANAHQSVPQRLEIEIERLLQATELGLSRSLDRVRFVIKVGPALGLMGTLIPMGISLAALAEGNIPKMAGSMVTAFTATVSGLGAGVLAYLIALVRERWAREDVREMAHSAELAIARAKASQQKSRHFQQEVDDALAISA